MNEVRNFTDAASPDLGEEEKEQYIKTCDYQEINNKSHDDL